MAAGVFRYLDLVLNTIFSPNTYTSVQKNNPQKARSRDYTLYISRERTGER